MLIFRLLDLEQMLIWQFFFSWKSAFHYSIKLPFDAEVAEKISLYKYTLLYPLPTSRCPRSHRTSPKTEPRWHSHSSLSIPQETNWAFQEIKWREGSGFAWTILRRICWPSLPNLLPIRGASPLSKVSFNDTFVTQSTHLLPKKLFKLSSLCDNYVFVTTMTWVRLIFYK